MSQWTQLISFGKSGFSRDSLAPTNSAVAAEAAPTEQLADCGAGLNKSPASTPNTDQLVSQQTRLISFCRSGFSRDSLAPTNSAVAAEAAPTKPDK